MKKEIEGSHEKSVEEIRLIVKGRKRVKKTKEKKEREHIFDRGVRLPPLNAAFTH